MKQQAQTILAKVKLRIIILFRILPLDLSIGDRSIVCVLQYGRRGISSVAASPMSSRVKHVWENQNKLVLGLAFFGGWFAKASISMVLWIHVIDVSNINSLECNYFSFLFPMNGCFRCFQEKRGLVQSTQIFWWGGEASWREMCPFWKGKSSLIPFIK